MTKEADTEGSAVLARRTESASIALNIPLGLIEQTDRSDIAESILNEIAHGATLDEILGSQAMGIANFVGREIEILGFKYQSSDFAGAEESDPADRWPYIVIDATVDGVRQIITTGARKVIVQVAALDKIGAFPALVKVRETLLDNNQSTYDLVRP